MDPCITKVPAFQYANLEIEWLNGYWEAPDHTVGSMGKVASITCNNKASAVVESRRELTDEKRNGRLAKAHSQGRQQLCLGR